MEREDLRQQSFAPSMNAFVCAACGRQYYFEVASNRRTDPLSNRRRSQQLRDKYKYIDEHLVNPFFVTLTIQNVSCCADGVKHIRDCFKKLCRRHPYNVWFAGGMYAIEISPKSDGFYNVHIHACIDSLHDLSRLDRVGGVSSLGDDCLFFDSVDTLKYDWFELTGDSYVVDWQRARYPKAAISYCLKYSTKETNFFGREDEVEMALRKTRLLSFFGCLYNMKGVKSRFVCVNCGVVGALIFARNLSGFEFKVIDSFRKDYNLPVWEDV